MTAHQDSRAKTLITHPNNDWKYSSEDLKGYLILQCHKDSGARFESFIITMKHIESRIENRVDKNSEDRIKRKKNRKFLSSVIRAIEVKDSNKAFRQ